MSYKLRRADSERIWSWSHRIKLVWTDPPFGTGKRQAQGNNRYEDVSPEAAIMMTCCAIGNLMPYLDTSSVVCVCADDRIIHDVVSYLKDVVGLCHQGDIIWTFGLGRPRSTWWPRRHNTIATFSLSPVLPAFSRSAIPTEHRKAPKPGYGATKPAGSVWDHTMSNTDPERVGYPNQKPLRIIEPFVLAHTNLGDVVADPFCGSGSTGVAALKHGRKFLGQDLNPAAIKVTARRLRTL